MSARPEPINEPAIASVASLELAITSDQRIGRRVVFELRLGRTLELRNDPLGERLAEFHPPLVEAIDLPDRALGEDAVLVERDQLAERRGRQAFQHQGVGWTV